MVCIYLLSLCVCPLGISLFWCSIINEKFRLYIAVRLSNILRRNWGGKIGKQEQRHFFWFPWGRKTKRERERKGLSATGHQSMYSAEANQLVFITSCARESKGPWEVLCCLCICVSSFTGNGEISTFTLFQEYSCSWTESCHLHSYTSFLFHIKELLFTT